MATETRTTATAETLRAYGECLADNKAPMGKRMRTVFLLKQIGTEAAIDTLIPALSDSSVLLAHEAAYVLGQMKNAYACDALAATLANLSLDPIVRHEAGEALGAIGDQCAVPVLTEFCADEHTEVAETCEIALARIQDLQTQREQKSKSEQDRKSGVKYHSVDPALPDEETSVPALKATLLDTKKPLYKRYQAMFALRNIGDEESVLALAAGTADTSALFKHEIAYVFGQMGHPASIPALKTLLLDSSEHAMVRHEAAEALGAMADPTCLQILKDYQKDEDPIVSESCDVALDIHDYWTTDQFDTALE